MAADNAAIATAAYFTVIRYLGRDPREPGPVLRSRIWDREEYPTLAAAVARRAALGRDAYGRGACIYAVTPDRMTVHVSEEYIRDAA